MRVLVTFCNPRSTPRLAACAIDTDTDERAWLPVPPAFDRGAAGIARIDDDLLVACQSGGVVRYGPDLVPKATIPTANARNLHSILYRPEENALYVVSAHNDTLFRYRLDDTGTRAVGADEIYCADPERRGQDRYHLNSVTEWQGNLYVTMFGPTNGPTHLHRRHGRVVRVDTGEEIVGDLYHPHSLFVHNDGLFVVESQARIVRRIAGGEPMSWEIPGGYPRGLVAADARHLWVGVSALRRESSSLGTPNVITSVDPVDFKTRLVELDLDTGTVGRQLDLTALAAEVFDVRALPASATFTPDPDRGLTERVDALEETFRRMRAERQELENRLRDTPVHRAQRYARQVAKRVLKRS